MHSKSPSLSNLPKSYETVDNPLSLEETCVSDRRDRENVEKSLQDENQDESRKANQDLTPMGFAELVYRAAYRRVAN